MNNNAFEISPAMVACPHCSGNGVSVYHPGTCPRVKAIEYFPDGRVKRVEFRDDVRDESLPRNPAAIYGTGSFHLDTITQS